MGSRAQVERLTHNGSSETFPFIARQKAGCMGKDTGRLRNGGRRMRKFLPNCIWFMKSENGGEELLGI